VGFNLELAKLEEFDFKQEVVATLYLPLFMVEVNFKQEEFVKEDLQEEFYSYHF
jgi:hypothetical protein